jgi:hypothetical protein
MSNYAVEKVCGRVVHEPELRAALETDPQTALQAARPPLSAAEISAVIDGDVGWLSKRGVNHFLLHQLGRWKLRGLDLPTYGERIREAYR